MDFFVIQNNEIVSRIRHFGGQRIFDFFLCKAIMTVLTKSFQYVLSPRLQQPVSFETFDLARKLGNPVL